MKIAVLGAGVMGTGIARAAAEGGFRVIVYDVVPEMMSKALANIEKAWAKSMERGKATAEQVDAWRSNIQCVDDIAAFADADLITEAIVENLDLKKKVVKQLDEICPASTVIASNTSVLSITAIASAAQKPERVIGTHYFNPVHAMKLVEIVPSAATSQETKQRAIDYVKAIGKVPAVASDTPGFIVNRVLTLALTEAMELYGEGKVTAVDIDTAMKLGTNWPIGPLALADMIGLDVLLDGVEALHSNFGDPKYRVPYILRQMVWAGHLGVKTGKGFHDYE